nr:class I SAM-dependent methyltransferase [Kribbella flavida]
MSQVGIDWQGWLQRWDDQQAGYLPDREQQFALMLEIVERLVGAPARFVDLACGPGSISARALTRFPATEIVGVDLDPFLLEIARQAVAPAAAGAARVRFAEADVRAPGWDAVLGDGPVDAVCSATALHWLDPSDLSSLAQTLAQRIRPGGVFLNADTMRLGPVEVPRLDALAVALRDEIWSTSHANGVEDWETWWNAAAAEPAFAELLAERERRFADRYRGREITLTDTVESFQGRLHRGRRARPGRGQAPVRRPSLTGRREPPAARANGSWEAAFSSPGADQRSSAPGGELRVVRPGVLRSPGTEDAEGFGQIGVVGRQQPGRVLQLRGRGQVAQQRLDDRDRVRRSRRLRTGMLGLVDRQCRLPRRAHGLDPALLLGPRERVPPRLPYHRLQLQQPRQDGGIADLGTLAGHQLGQHRRRQAEHPGQLRLGLAEPVEQPPEAVTQRFAVPLSLQVEVACVRVGHDTSELLFANCECKR